MSRFSTLVGLISDTVKRVARIDPSTNSLQTIDYAHHEIHGGSSYHISIYGDDIRDTPMRIKMIIPAQAKRIHMLASGYSGGNAIFSITEDPTGGATGGTSIIPVNRRRDSVNTSSTTCTEADTAPTGGVILLNESQGVDKDKSSGESRGSSEWVLGKTSASTTYVISLVGTGDNMVGKIVLEWYEHTDKD